MESDNGRDTGKLAEESFASGYYCAESVVLTIAKAHGIESKLLPGIATAFCGGMSRTGGPCGALTGAVMGVGLVLGRNQPGDSVNASYMPTQQLVREFEQAFGARNCSELLGCDLGTPEGRETFRAGHLRERCRGYTGKATEIAMSVIGRQPLRIEAVTALEEIVALLGECHLPTADVELSPSLQFFGARFGGTLAAVVGIELNVPFGLLRSLAVRPALRQRGYARALVAHAESFAATQGVETLFLLTTTAERYFLDLGYTPASRDDAPESIRNSAQFAGLCPTSASFLSKRIAGR